jgi:hypothetical protein
MTADYGEDTVTLRVRETRLILERILLPTRIPMGLIPAVRDAILYAEAMGLAAFERLVARLDRLSRPVRPIEAADLEDGAVRADCMGQHAWIIAPQLVDLAVARCELSGHGVVLAESVDEPGDMIVARGLAARHGVGMNVTAPTTGAGQVTMTAVPGQFGASQRDPLLHRLLREALAVPRPLWQSLYDLSNRALTADTPVTRRHAGAVIVEADGRIIGRCDIDVDDETGQLGSGMDDTNRRLG